MCDMQKMPSREDASWYADDFFLDYLFIFKIVHWSNSDAII